MKQRLNKLLAVVLSAALCVPMLPAGGMKAADAGVVFTDEEQIFVNVRRILMTDGNFTSDQFLVRMALSLMMQNGITWICLMILVLHRSLQQMEKKRAVSSWEEPDGTESIFHCQKSWQGKEFC